MRIDSHHHIWDLAIQPQPWIDGDTMKSINKDFSMEDLKNEISGSKIEKTILCQTARNTAETKYFLHTAASDPTIVGVIGWLDLNSDSAKLQIEDYKNVAGNEFLVGFREMAQDISDSGFLARPTVIQNVQMLGSLGFTYDLLIKEPQMDAAIQLVESAPETQFVIDHLGKPQIADKKLDAWKQNIESLANFPNTVCKVSGMVTESRWNSWEIQDFEPYFDVVLEAFGPSRLMFGSDWPVALLSATYSEVVTLAEKLTSSFSRSEEDSFWRNTAVQTYKINLPSE